MTLDLTQFHESFFEESFEALGSMEAALLELDVGDADAELINTIFRVAHSIKGGSATFGFSEVATLTHTLETLLDQLRSGRRQIQPEIVDVLLRSVDMLRTMLTATRKKQPVDAELAAVLHAELQAIMQGAASVGAPPAPAPAAARATPEPGGASASCPVLRCYGMAMTRCVCCANSRSSERCRCAWTQASYRAWRSSSLNTAC
jgi:two-component system chemotaxis sensor kinase CheA